MQVELKKLGFRFSTASTNKPQNILHASHVLGRDRACPRPPVAENAVDKGWVVLQAFHLDADRAEFGHREIDKRRFEGREIPAAEGLQDIDFRLAVAGGINAAEIFGFAR